MLVLRTEVAVETMCDSFLEEFGRLNFGSRKVVEGREHCETRLPVWNLGN